MSHLDYPTYLFYANQHHGGTPGSFFVKNFFVANFFIQGGGFP